MFDPRRVLRWIYIGRLSLATAIFVAALITWRRADEIDTLVATLTLIITAALHRLVGLVTRTGGRASAATFAYLQSLFDVALVTAVVHLTGGALSLFAPLYILVTVGASLLVPVRGVLLVAALGIVAYFADVFGGREARSSASRSSSSSSSSRIVALAVAYLAARMQEAGVGREELEAQLNIAKLQAEDILRNIRAGIITIDARGRVIFANPMRRPHARLRRRRRARAHRARSVRRRVAGARSSRSSARCTSGSASPAARR